MAVNSTAAFLLIASYLAISITPAFGQSSVEEDFTITFDERTFEVHASATNVDVKEVRVEPEFFSVSILLEAASSAGEITINLPRALLDAKHVDDQSADGEFIIIVGSDVGDYEEVETNELERMIAISVPAGTSEIEIIGNRVVPEFPFATLVIIIGLGSTIAVLRLKNNLLPASNRH